MVVKTFRGLLADGGQDQIRLQTIKGKVGYKIVKFELMGEKPTQVDPESIVKIYKTKQSSIDATVNFTDSDLLAAGFYKEAQNIQYPVSHQIIVDNEIFNQDIYVTHKDNNTGEQCNYYIELEVIPLSDQAAEYSTIKDIRSNA